ncbi:transposable element Tcb2 transposase [Trichonephila clavipes]|nr:transposable element Tcb2 transposase [Trichonephila clavipes]
MLDSGECVLLTIAERAERGLGNMNSMKMFEETVMTSSLMKLGNSFISWSYGKIFKIIPPDLIGIILSVLNLARDPLQDDLLRVLRQTLQQRLQSRKEQAKIVDHLAAKRYQDLNRFLETGSAGRRPAQGRRRATTPNQDRYLVLTARRHRNKKAILLQQHLRSATGTTVSTQTVRNRFRGVGLYTRRLIVCVRLTSRHRRDRREWATEHVNWRRNEWSNVLFSDESRFSVHPDNRRILIWRDRGSRNNSAFVHESVRVGSGGVLVYGGISIDGRTDLYIVRDGPLTARRYSDEILRPIVVPYAAAIGDDFTLMDDNCRSHRANLVKDFLFEDGIVRMEWPACSPYLNPIEHV